LQQVLAAGRNARIAGIPPQTKSQVVNDLSAILAQDHHQVLLLANTDKLARQCDGWLAGELITALDHSDAAALVELRNATSIIIDEISLLQYTTLVDLERYFRCVPSLDTDPDDAFQPFGGRLVISLQAFTLDPFSNCAECGQETGRIWNEASCLVS